MFELVPTENSSCQFKTLVRVVWNCLSCSQDLWVCPCVFVCCFFLSCISSPVAHRFLKIIQSLNWMTTSVWRLNKNYRCYCLLAHCASLFSDCTMFLLCMRWKIAKNYTFSVAGRREQWKRKFHWRTFKWYYTKWIVCGTQLFYGIRMKCRVNEIQILRIWNAFIDLWLDCVTVTCALSWLISIFLNSFEFRR